MGDEGSFVYYNIIIVNEFWRLQEIFLLSVCLLDLHKIFKYDMAKMTNMCDMDLRV